MAKDVPSDVLWYLQALIEVCPDYGQAKKLDGLLEQLFSASADARSSAISLFSSEEPHAAFLNAVFDAPTDVSPIETLHARGYLKRGSPNFLQETASNPDTMRELLDCMMWVYLDHRRPIHGLKAAIGQTKANSCSDPETSILVWVNTIVKRSTPLPPASSISRHFFGLPHFRVVLYNFLRDDTLLHLSTSPDENAAVGLAKATEIGLRPPFQPSAYDQSPLLLMCYLYRCVAVLSLTKPPAPLPPISRTSIAQMMQSVEDKKREVRVVAEKVDSLQVVVQEISEKLKTMKRPATSLGIPRATRAEGDEAARPQTSLSPTPEAKRVTWELPDEAPDKGDDGPEQPPDE
jgi:hypothetical protein